VDASFAFAPFAVVVKAVVVGAAVVDASSVTAKPPIGKLATSFSGSVLFFFATAGAEVLDAKVEAAFKSVVAGDMGLAFFVTKDIGSTFFLTG
jgi:hypothetical protein